MRQKQKAKVNRAFLSLVPIYINSNLADVTPDGKQLLPDTHKARGVTCALPVFGESGRTWGKAFPFPKNKWE